MIHVDNPLSSPTPQLKQVEFNTIASSFGGLSTRAAVVHKFLVDIGAYPKEVEDIINVGKFPENDTATQLAAGLAFAHKSYLQATSTQNDVCVLFVVQGKERNVFDQRHLEEPLLDNFEIRTYRVAFHDVLEETRLGDDGSLLFCPPHLPGRVFEVSVVYFRAGYSPDEYQSEKDWTARKELERSRAIKCPGVLTQLAGLKKVQQVLATPDSKYLERFIKNPVHAEALRQTFAPMYPMDQSEAGLEGRRLALDAQSAKRFVLKPQREGGGNNIYRDAIPTFLRGKPEKEWEAYILMEMIEPPPQRNTILRNGKIESGGVICELGVYGVCLWEHGTQPVDGNRGVIHNSLAGYLLRTKGDQSEEGGVAAGFGALDSLCLVSDENLRAISEGVVKDKS
jgi:glutathione synthase